MPYIKDYSALQQALKNAGFYDRPIDGRFLYMSGRARSAALAATGIDMFRSRADWFAPPSVPGELVEQAAETGEDPVWPPEGWGDEIIDRPWPDANAQIALEQWFLAQAGAAIAITGISDDAHVAALRAYELAHPGSVAGISDDMGNG